MQGNSFFEIFRFDDYFLQPQRELYNKQGEICFNEIIFHNGKKLDLLILTFVVFFIILITLGASNSRFSLVHAAPTSSELFTALYISYSINVS